MLLTRVRLFSTPLCTCAPRTFKDGERHVMLLKWLPLWFWREMIWLFVDKTLSERSSVFSDGTRFDVWRDVNPFCQRVFARSDSIPRELLSLITQTSQRLLKQSSSGVSWQKASKVKLSPVIYNYVYTEMKRETLQQWQTMRTLEYWGGGKNR